MEESVSKRVQFHGSNWLTNVRLHKPEHLLSFGCIQVGCLGDALDDTH